MENKYTEPNASEVGLFGRLALSAKNDMRQEDERLAVSARYYQFNLVVLNKCFGGVTLATHDVVTTLTYRPSLKQKR